jgi:hypothetical protein
MYRNIYCGLFIDRRTQFFSLIILSPGAKSRQHRKDNNDSDHRGQRMPVSSLAIAITVLDKYFCAYRAMVE